MTRRASKQVAGRASNPLAARFRELEQAVRRRLDRIESITNITNVTGSAITPPYLSEGVASGATTPGAVWTEHMRVSISLSTPSQVMVTARLRWQVVADTGAARLVVYPPSGGSSVSSIEMSIVGSETVRSTDVGLWSPTVSESGTWTYAIEVIDGAGGLTASDQSNIIALALPQG